MNNTSQIKAVNIVQNHINNIYDFSHSWNGDYKHLHSFFKSLNINSSYDIDIIKPYFKDWSNMEGFALAVLKEPSSFS